MKNAKASLACLAAFVLAGGMAPWAQASKPGATSRESELLAVLKSDKSEKDKADACMQLARIGTKPNQNAALPVELSCDQVARDRKVQAVRHCERLRAADVVVEVGVAAVDDDVIRREQAGQRGDRRFRRVAGGHHHPDRARRRERLDERVERRSAGRAG